MGFELFPTEIEVRKLFNRNVAIPLSVKHLPYFCLARDGHMSYLLILHYIIGRTTGVDLHDTFETGSSK